MDEHTRQGQGSRHKDLERLFCATESRPGSAGEPELCHTPMAALAPTFSFIRGILLILWTVKTDVSLTICQKCHSKSSTIKNGLYM